MGPRSERMAWTCLPRPPRWAQEVREWPGLVCPRPPRWAQEEREWPGLVCPWVLGLEVCLGGKCFGLESGVFGFGRVLEGRVLEVRLAGAWLGGAISKWDGQMFKILLPHKSRKGGGFPPPTSGFIIITNAGVKWVRHACQGFEWVWDGFWLDLFPRPPRWRSERMAWTCLPRPQDGPKK